MANSIDNHFSIVIALNHERPNGDKTNVFVSSGCYMYSEHDIYYLPSATEKITYWSALKYGFFLRYLLVRFNCLGLITMTS